MINQLSFDASLYDQALDNGHYIYEYTVLRESSFLLGRFIMGMILIPFIILWGIKVTFVFAVVGTLLMGIINRQKAVR